MVQFERRYNTQLGEVRIYATDGYYGIEFGTWIGDDEIDTNKDNLAERILNHHLSTLTYDFAKENAENAEYDSEDEEYGSLIEDVFEFRDAIKCALVMEKGDRE